MTSKTLQKSTTQPFCHHFSDPPDWPNMLIHKNHIPETDAQQIIAVLLDEALNRKATEIFLEPQSSGMTVYYRIHGRLCNIAYLDSSMAERIQSIATLAAQPLQCGEYNVCEGISKAGCGKQFSTYFIPRGSTSSIIWRRLDDIANAHTPHLPSPTKNIHKKVFIWQMGKVGSLTIYFSLMPYSSPTIWDVPSIVNDRCWPLHDNILQTHDTKLLYDFLHHSDEEFIIISLVRDLLDRNISTIFQSMNFEEEWRNEYFIAGIDDFKKMPYEQQEQEIAVQLQKINTDPSTTAWYDNLLRSHFYYPDVDRYFIDVYSKPFNWEKGYQLYESKSPRVKMLILRMEDMNSLEHELGSFLDIPDFKLRSGNYANDKWYHPVYKKFKDRYRPSDKELTAIYQSRFMQYFYSPEQLDKKIAHWRGQ